MPSLSVDAQAARYQSIVLRALASLANGNRRAETLHRVRVHLRRLQAYLELLGKDEDAAILSRCVSRFSRLRTLQVFRGYLARIGAPKTDREKVDKLIELAVDKLRDKKDYDKVERLVWRHALAAEPTDAGWLDRRFAALAHLHLTALEELLAAASKKPRRKRLHALRLRIKSIRYQEEWGFGRDPGKARFVDRLKDAQTVLGKYEELAEFKKLGKKLELESYPQIVKDWRRARKRARAVPDRLDWLLKRLAMRRCVSEAQGAGASMAG